jgi:hypothetical protein
MERVQFSGARSSRMRFDLWGIRARRLKNVSWTFVATKFREGPGPNTGRTAIYGPLTRRYPNSGIAYNRHCESAGSDSSGRKDWIAFAACSEVKPSLPGCL